MTAQLERNTEPLMRVWRESFGQWWAELLAPRNAESPPPPFKRAHRDDWPDEVDDYYCVALALRSTRRGARRAALEMGERYRAGQPAREPPVVEYVS